MLDYLVFLFSVTLPTSVVNSGESISTPSDRKKIMNKYSFYPKITYLVSSFHEDQDLCALVRG